MTSNEAAKSPGGFSTNVHFKALRLDPAAASFTLWKPLAAGFMFKKKKKRYMLHFHSNQSADAVPGKLHNDVDIANWLCKKMIFSEEKYVGKKQQMISVYTYVQMVLIPFLFGQEGTETRKQPPCQRYQCSPSYLRAAVGTGQHISMNPSTPPPWSHQQAHPQCYMIRWVTLLTLLSVLLFLPRKSSESRRP